MTKKPRKRIWTNQRLRTGDGGMGDEYRFSRDLTGYRFTKWVVLGIGEMRGHSNQYWKCRCDCGKEKEVRGKCLVYGLTTQCNVCMLLTNRKRIKGRLSVPALEELVWALSAELDLVGGDSRKIKARLRRKWNWRTV